MKNNSVTNTYPDIEENYTATELLARSLVLSRLSNIKGGLILIRDQKGESLLGDGIQINATIMVNRMRFYKAVLLSGSKGAAASFRDGDWACSKLTTLIRLMIRNIESLDQIESGSAGLFNMWSRLLHKTRSNNRKGSSNNIKAHYDLGNEMFQLFLDPTMTYSCGIFESAETTLEEASLKKLDTICRKLDLHSTDHIVEIGTGWGSFAIHAARNYGCTVTTTTISRDQYELARRRIKDAGLGDRIELLLCDYRDMTGQYDKLVSIEMIEAVGDEFLPEYFAKCASLVKPDGQLLIQAISMPDKRYEDYLKRTDFIQQFIFPGSCVPSLSAMLKYIGQHTDLRVENIENIGPHYAKTLRNWLDNFMKNRERIEALGYSREFTRLWEYYLCYCEAGFKEKYLGTLHLHLSRSEYALPVLD